MQTYDMSKYSFVNQNVKKKRGFTIAGRHIVAQSDPYRYENTSSSTAKTPKSNNVVPRQRNTGFTIAGKPRTKIESEGPGPGESYGAPSCFAPTGKKITPGYSLANRLRMPRGEDSDYSLELNVSQAFQRTQLPGPSGAGPSAIILRRPYVRPPEVNDTPVSSQPPVKRQQVGGKVVTTFGRPYHHSYVSVDEVPGPGSYKLSDTWTAQSKGVRKGITMGKVTASSSTFIDSRNAKHVFLQADRNSGGFPF